MYNFITEFVSKVKNNFIVPGYQTSCFNSFERTGCLITMPVNDEYDKNNITDNSSIKFCGTKRPHSNN